MTADELAPADATRSVEDAGTDDAGLTAAERQADVRPTTDPSAEATAPDGHSTARADADSDGDEQASRQPANGPTGLEVTPPPIATPPAAGMADQHPPARAIPTPGPRAATFQSLLASTLSHTLAAISYRNFAACFPTMAERIPNELKAAHARMVGRLGDIAQNEFDQILDRRNVVENLNQLELLLADARQRKAQAKTSDPGPTAPHLQPPAAIVAAQLAPHFAAQQSQLNARLQTTQSQNATLYDTVRAQRSEIQSLLASLDTVVADLDAAVGGLDRALDAGAQGELVATTREVEMELAGIDG